ncbi:MAG: N-acetyltransferase [Gammaproteobacteria bacterium]|nr:N-acetyltransferase [Gammaproteobacteria bacterium]
MNQQTLSFINCQVRELTLDALPIRESIDKDLPAIVQLHRRAFADEDLVPLVEDLLGSDEGVMSLVAVIEDQIVGHVVFTHCNVPAFGNRAVLLGPLAVDPDVQRQGIGGRIVENGLQRLARDRVAVVFVLGDPAYYSRFGFSPEAFIEPPYPLPKELESWKDAWQSKYLTVPPATEKARLSVPRQWQRPELWAP